MKDYSYKVEKLFIIHINYVLRKNLCKLEKNLPLVSVVEEIVLHFTQKFEQINLFCVGWSASRFC